MIEIFRHLRSYEGSAEIVPKANPLLPLPPSAGERSHRPDTILHYLALPLAIYVTDDVFEITRFSMIPSAMHLSQSGLLDLEVKMPLAFSLF